MSTNRVMFDGRVDLTGETFGTLLVQRMVARRPEPSYACLCQRCNTETTATHSRLRNGAARCQFSGCGKTSKRPEHLDSSENVAAQRQAELEAAQLQASAARMDFETQDYQRPERYAPTPDPLPPMSAREVAASRERREQQDAERRAAEAPRLEAERLAAEEQEAAEASQRGRAEKQRKYWAEAILDGPDPKLFVTDAMQVASMPKKDAEAFTTKAAAQFATEPEYAVYRTLENADIILAYLHRNGVFIADVETIRAAFRRLRDLGLLKAKPSPATQPQPTEPQRVNLTVTPATPKALIGPKTYIGRDYATGAERTFTQREVDRMSSLEYQRAFQIVPTISELFTTMNSNTH